MLTDAMVRVRSTASASHPQPVSADMLSDGHFDSQLVSIEATLLSVESSAGRELCPLHRVGTCSRPSFISPTPAIASLPLRTVACCALRASARLKWSRGNTDNLLNKDPVSFKLIIRSPSDIQVLRGGSWWTLRHSSALLGILALVVLLSAARIVILLRRIEGKNEELRMASQKDSAIRQLISAMQEVRIKMKFTSRVSLPEADELALLGTEFNHMVDELHVRDIAMAEAEAKLQQQALSDVLTGLPNRRLLSDRISQSIEAAKRQGTMVAVPLRRSRQIQTRQRQLWTQFRRCAPDPRGPAHSSTHP